MSRGMRNERQSVRDLPSVKVENLPFYTSVEELRLMFERYGRIGDVYLPRDSTNQSRGFGFVRFYNRREAEHAANQMDGYVVGRRELRCKIANNSPIDDRAARQIGGRRGRSRSRSPIFRARQPSRARSPRRARRNRSPSPRVEQLPEDIDVTPRPCLPPYTPCTALTDAVKQLRIGNLCLASELLWLAAVRQLQKLGSIIGVTLGNHEALGYFGWYLIDQCCQPGEKETLEDQWDSANDCHVNLYNEDLSFGEVLENSNKVLNYIKRLQEMETATENRINKEAFRIYCMAKNKWGKIPKKIEISKD